MRTIITAPSGTTAQPQDASRPAPWFSHLILAATIVGTSCMYADRTAEHRVDGFKSPLVRNFSTVPAQKSKALLDPRSAAMHVANIVDALSIRMSDIGHACKVTRQMVYRWKDGSSMPDGENMERLLTLSHIADDVAKADIAGANKLLSIKMFQGKSLLELVRNGEVSVDHVNALINEARIMESEYQRSGLTTIKASPTRDWQANLSIPGGFEST